eukprot:TRINITY_DN4402_c0_g1_i12.p1 TRINITY_DN4402_c0_g1~~TRINITY_DN4402_c0_g1_i12.p1  ORF type:complete len:333 (+),score=74.81 TRINITY_DN4402_c0_g1_i12:89-1087(+)
MISASEVFAEGCNNVDTRQVARDSDTVLAGHSSYKISQILLFYREEVVGLQFWYITSTGEEIQGNEAIGKDTSDAKEHSIELADDEYIVEVHGRAGSVVDYLGFVTNKGRRVEGGGKGGDLFQYKVGPNEQFVTFSLGVGKQLHQITGYKAQVTNLDDVDFKYLTNYSSNANQHYYAPIEQEGVQKSAKAGEDNSDTRHWDDFLVITNKDKDVQRIEQINVYTEGETIGGIEIQYRLSGSGTYTSVHRGSKANEANLKKHSLVFSADDHITEVSGRNTDVITSLRIQTSSGKSLEVGGHNGLPFSNLVPSGKRVVGFGGGVNGHLHLSLIHI